MMLKRAGPSMWVRSTQLCIFCGAVAFCFAWAEHTHSNEPFWYGFTWWTWAPIICESVGGVLTALVMKHADVVVKSFAIGLAIVVSTLLSFFFFGFTPSSGFACGAPLVIGSLFLYNIQPSVVTPTSTTSALAAGNKKLE